MEAAQVAVGKSATAISNLALLSEQKRWFKGCWRLLVVSLCRPPPIDIGMLVAGMAVPAASATGPQIGVSFGYGARHRVRPSE